MRQTLAEHLRLRRARTVYGVHISLALGPEEASSAGSIDQKLLRTWAGPHLAGLVPQLMAMARGDPVSEVSIAKTAKTPSEIDAIERRAKIFASLVTFSVAEHKLAAETRRGLQAAPEHPPSAADDSR